ncbi:hypothetical protein A2230_04865 [candidate division WOR-1 bacterium RIFOXYA2_FULL_36_21]|uniref:Uncharacterized protein n=1 Tax=candidate division WOR-1 bacterium RIFOXYB2_FULL_36_35 TaxID=1802578 RepID=A0A1F4S5M3_UNCSA|nr:MAG: hypothetical protein A2230_04865 [candidate division WOR-1 bacterium RIFOXYA2_FULL_36_21]OGC15736.1 MAG: hypothetical protein A2290_05290 [candidate division WOR-1 bacterium RIFOXYB2_FULL_36_35]OGC21091.1 MAG: hypothetical protein A2282_03620 [candidate division WOR-1 bacterium RIFOXYA12_FULL_36_13]
MNKGLLIGVIVLGLIASLFIVFNYNAMFGMVVNFMTGGDVAWNNNAIGTTQGGVIHLAARPGKGINPPKQFPKDLPIYPKANIITLSIDTTQTPNSINTIMESDDNTDMVNNFYKSEMPKNGWTLKEDSAGMMMTDWTKDNRKLSIMISKGKRGNQNTPGCTIIITD